MKKLAFLFPLIFFFHLVFFASVSAQNLNEMNKQIRNLVENRDYISAINELKKLRQADKKVFEINNYDYLLARLSEKIGDTANASGNYQAVVNRNSVLTEYALWHLAEISRFTGNLFLERIYLRELLTAAPDGLMNEAVKARIARNYFESKDYDAAIAALRSNINFSNAKKDEKVSLPTILPNEVFGGLTKNDAKTRENLVWLGKAFLRSGKNENARTVFSRLVDELPNPAQPDDFALEGVRGLDQLAVGIENCGKVAPQLTDKEHIKRAAIYQFNRDFDDARLHYRALIANFPNNPNVPMAMFQIGRGFVQERNFSQAADWFERIQAEFPENGISQDALSQTASAYARVNKTKEAISRYEKYIEKYSDDDNLSRAYLNIVDVLRDQGEPSSALKWTAKTREDFRDEVPAAVATFAQARIHLAQSDWQKALADLESLRFAGNLGGGSVSGGTDKNEITFLKAMCLEQLSRYDEAIDAYLSISDGRQSFYGWRANERLQLLIKNPQTNDFARGKFYPLRTKVAQNITARNAEEIKEAAQTAIRLTDVQQTREQLLETIRKAYSFLPEYKTVPTPKLLNFGRAEVLSEKRVRNSANFHQALADELLFLGLYDEGTPELEISWKMTDDSENSESKDQTQNNKDRNYTLAVYYERGDMANRTAAYIEPLWRKVPDDYQIELIPREQIELLYPAPYVDSLLKFAAPRNVDPRFILAIMRQESRFRADVKSVAAARGLMQFISSTSVKIAFELGENNFRQDNLYHPPTAILFGSQYLSNLFHQFPDQPPAVAASYNGGEDNMTRWYARANSSDPDRYVSEILYSQTKDYVYKVMQNYRVYQMIYDDKLKTVSKIE